MSKQNHFEREKLFNEYVHVLTYFNETNRKIVSLNLLLNGIQIFSYATCIRGINELKEINLSRMDAEAIKKLYPFLNDNIMDKTRIITCFENYMKSKLILKGYLVHFVTKKHKSQRSLQENTPISTHNIFDSDSFKDLINKPKHSFDVFNKTITFSMMLKKDYQDIIQMPNDILNCLKEINIVRNRLHFIPINDYSFGPSVIDQIEMLVLFMDEVIKPEFYKLKEELNQS